MNKVPNILEAAAATYRQRNKKYGDNYKNIGHVMCGLFPKGLTINDADAWNKLAIILAIAVKLGRYTNQFPNGQTDSAHDASVYAAMLQELTDER